MSNLKTKIGRLDEIKKKQEKLEAEGYREVDYEQIEMAIDVGLYSVHKHNDEEPKDTPWYVIHWCEADWWR